MRLNSALFAFLFLLVSLEGVQAKEFPVQARLFAGSTKADPENLNTELSAQSLKEVSWIAKYGVEILFPVAKYLDMGFRYSKRYMQRDETNSSNLTDYEAVIDQDSVLGVVRVPFFKTSILRLDAFAGFGGSNTSYKIKTATQDGGLNRKDENGWLASPYSCYGGSLGVGYKLFYFYVEGGVETNKIDGFKRSGNINGNVNTIDLTGSYLTVGLMFDGVPATRK